MRDAISSEPLRPAQPLTWWPRVGAAGFAFFLVKGLLWLLAPVLLALLR